MHMPNEKSMTVEITFSSFVKAVIFILFLWGIYHIRDIVAVVLFSIVIASAIDPMADWFSRRHVPRVLSVIFIYLVALAVVAAIFYLLIPNLVGEISLFVDKIPGYFSEPTGLSSLFPAVPESFSTVLVEMFNNLKTHVAGFTSGFFQTAVGIFGSVLSFILIVVLSFYLAVQKDGLENFLKIVTPVQYEAYILDLWNRTRKKIGLWFQGQIILAVLVGVLVFLGLTILRVEYALSLAILAAVFEIIPIFGPILASIPAVAIAFVQSPVLAVVVIGLYVIIQQFENHLIYPLVVRKIIGVPPILAILALVIGGTAGGFLGILLAVPIATALKEFLNDLAAKKHVEFK